jgi:thiamine biosynthesis protein ThiI
MHTHIIVHYSEIGTKGQNRSFFEKKLAKNIKYSLKGLGIKQVKRDRGRIVLEINKKYNEKKISEKLKRIPGIANFSFAISCPLNIEKMKKAIDKLIVRKKTFKIEASRSNKKFKYTSPQINEILGEYVWKKTKMKGKMKNPQITFFVEISDRAYLYTKKTEGVGGLPVGTAGKVVCLLSGGIDSPVAAYKMMTRGCEVIFVHFHNYTSRIEEKIEKIVGELNKYQLRSKVYIVPFLPIQENIIENVPDKYRMIVYRRIMMNIAEKIMIKENAKAIVTGDSLAQVASQTLENLSVIHSATDKQILAPLVGKSKIEIIALSKRIGTYDLSIQPYRDCCAYMIAKHPATRARKDTIENFEKELDKNKFDKAVERADVKML